MKEKYAMYDTFTNGVKFYEREEEALKDYEQLEKDISGICDEDTPEHVFLFQVIKQGEVK